MRAHSFRSAAVCVVWLSGLALAGCQPSTGATVVGVLTINGKPAPAGVRIDFEPQVKNGSTSTGFTDSSGRYEMMFNVYKVGVMPGESIVRISIDRDMALNGTRNPRYERP